MPEIRNLSTQMDKYLQKKILASLFYLREDENTLRQNILVRKSPVDSDLLVSVTHSLTGTFRCR